MRENFAGTFVSSGWMHRNWNLRIIPLTWSFPEILPRNLEHPDVAYREWVRVLKAGGKLLNFDANWYGYLYEEEQRKAYENDRKNVENNSLDDHYLCTDIERMERIALQVPLSKIRRPQWDVKTLREAGLLGIHTDTEIWKTVWSEEERLNYQSTPMFMVTGVKPDHFLNLPVAAGEKTEGFLELEMENLSFLQPSSVEKILEKPFSSQQVFMQESM